MFTMNTQTQEALHKALKVLNCLNNDRVYETAWVKGAINACEEALEQPSFDYNTAFSHGYEAHKAEQPAQEPVAWLWLQHGKRKSALLNRPSVDIDLHWKNNGFSAEPLYTHPAPSCSCKDKK